MSSRTTRVVTGLGIALVVSFVLHYVLFGSLPVGRPALLRDEE